jgi:hypothetical protein
LGAVTVGSEGATPAVTTGPNTGLFWKDPAAWQLDQVGAMKAIAEVSIKVRKRMRLIAVPAKPNRADQRTQSQSASTPAI